MFTVHIVDDDASFRKALARRLKIAGYDVESYSSAQHLFSCLSTAEGPGCILLDVQMPEVTGLEVQKSLLERNSVLPIIFVTAYSDTAATVRAIKAGAEDFLVKPVSSGQLIDAIERARLHYDIILKKKIELDTYRKLFATLTPREKQVFGLIVRGKINKQIAFDLGTTERTVKAHRHEVMQKMQVQSLAELVSVAQHIGLLNLEACSI